MSRPILVVDDEDVVRRSAEMVLNRQGYRVSTARTPAEARSALATELVEDLCLLVDLVLGEENGLHLAEEMAANHRGLRVLLMSGYTDDVLVGASHLAPRIRFLKKPFTSKELIEAVGMLCATTA